MEKQILSVVKALKEKKADGVIFSLYDYFNYRLLDPWLYKVDLLENAIHHHWLIKKQIGSERLYHLIQNITKTDVFKDYTNQLIDLYFAHKDTINRNDLYTFLINQSRLSKFDNLFKKYAKQYNFDWRLIASISYQESHWRLGVESFTGVKGLMMLTETTALDLNIKNREDPEQSIRGGVKYLNRLLQIIPEDSKPLERLLMSLLAYNMGYNNLKKLMNQVDLKNIDPNQWTNLREELPKFSQKKCANGLCISYGQEAYNYVRNIRRFYDTMYLLYG